MSEPARAASAAEQTARDNPIGDAIAQSRTLWNGVCETLGSESRAFYSDWARDGAEALRGLQAATSPLDLAAVQQKWLLARSGSWLDASARVLAGAFLLAEDSVATLKDYRLPE